VARCVHTCGTVEECEIFMKEIEDHTSCVCIGIPVAEGCGMK
jgi:hypothetical protein